MSSSKIILFRKGLNENKSALELSAAELYECINYELSNGNYAGLTLIDGYEVYDGTVLASETSVVIDGDGVVTDYSARAAVTAGITKSNTADTPVLATLDYDNIIWTIKADAGGQHYLYQATGTGWSTGIAITGATSTTQTYTYYKGRIANYKTNEEFIILSNGVSQPFILHHSGITTTIDYLDATGTLPSDATFSGTKTYPTIPIVWNQRVILAYPGGHIFFCNTGSDPTIPASWDPLVASAGEIYLEDEITDLLIAPSSCIVFCDHMIHILKQGVIDAATGVDFTKEVFSDNAGALWDTAQNILGHILYCDDRGISSLKASDTYGDFAASVMSKEVQNTYDAIKDNIISTEVNRERNQYKIYTSLGRGLTVTFNSDATVKGITQFKYLTVPSCTHESGWFGSEDGFVYKYHIGAESFNNVAIPGYIATSYFTYNTPTQYKSFIRGLIELKAERGLTVNFKPIFDYGAGETPRALTELIDTSDLTLAGIWGEGTWGTFYWGGADENRKWIYFPGIGSNMSLTFSTSDRFHSPHTFHNIIVSYTQLAEDF